MPAKPNFTRMDRRGGAIVVTGQTDPDPPGDLLGIQVVVSQGAQTTAATVRVLGSDWNVELSDDGFAAGPASVVGVETRRENATTITWVQTLEIP